MQPLSSSRQYGIPMPHEHPYGPQDGGAGPPPPLWQPGPGQNPYESIRIPALPDMRGLPPELQDFRDQCATGVRQAVAMITAMEHQLWWERSRRQQAEEDCKVLLGAVHTERGLGEALLGAEERRRAEAAAAGAKLTLAADELHQASEAATTIQKHVRGRIARKEFESHLRDILRGVDPALDPAQLPAAAAHHISSVNAAGAPRHLGLRALLGDLDDKQGPPGAAGGSAADMAGATSYYRRQVDRIGQRLAGHKDAGEPHPGDSSGDPLQADVKQLLSGNYPASSAQVIAALVRRCRELQAALLEAAGELQEARMSMQAGVRALASSPASLLDLSVLLLCPPMCPPVCPCALAWHGAVPQGLKDANARLSELSEVRAELEAARADNLRLAGSVAKLRAALAAGAAGANAAAAAENPFVAAWYRKAYADKEWQRVPPVGGGPGSVALLDGPDTAVETWDDLRASIPEPVMVPRTEDPGRRYKDLMQLKQDMISAARQGPPDPLYSMAVPDRSSFVYARDTPLVPMQSAAPIIRESLPPDAFMGLHEDLPRRTPRGSAPGSGASTRGGAPPPGSLLPSSAIRAGPGASGAATPRGGGPSPRSDGGASAGVGSTPGGVGSTPGGVGSTPGGGPYSQLAEQQERLRRQAEWEAQHGAGREVSLSGGGGGTTPRGQRLDFGYNRDTPVVPVYSVLPLIREDDFVRCPANQGVDDAPGSLLGPLSAFRKGTGLGVSAPASAHRHRPGQPSAPPSVRTAGFTQVVGFDVSPGSASPAVAYDASAASAFSASTAAFHRAGAASPGGGPLSVDVSAGLISHVHCTADGHVAIAYGNGRNQGGVAQALAACAAPPPPACPPETCLEVGRRYLAAVLAAVSGGLTEAVRSELLALLRGDVEVAIGVTAATPPRRGVGAFLETLQADNSAYDNWHMTLLSSAAPPAGGEVFLWVDEGARNVGPVLGLLPPTNRTSRSLTLHHLRLDPSARVTHLAARYQLFAEMRRLMLQPHLLPPEEREVAEMAELTAAAEMGAAAAAAEAAAAGSAMEVEGGEALTAAPEVAAAQGEGGSGGAAMPPPPPPAGLRAPDLTALPFVQRLMGGLPGVRAEAKAHGPQGEGAAAQAQAAYAVVTSAPPVLAPAGPEGYAAAPGAAGSSQLDSTTATTTPATYTAVAEAMAPRGGAAAGQHGGEEGGLDGLVPDFAAQAGRGVATWLGCVDSSYSGVRDVFGVTDEVLSVWEALGLWSRLPGARGRDQVLQQLQQLHAEYDISLPAAVAVAWCLTTTAQACSRYEAAGGAGAGAGLEAPEAGVEVEAERGGSEGPLLWSSLDVYGLSPLGHVTDIVMYRSALQGEAGEVFRPELLQQRPPPAADAPAA
ncbi:hypothetical protein GPECTOR_39g437 [Gonium pectorale]|uniref:Uncharacterized protein n=1 Tax=Gonium pectorale TaxID=33097 RepID=A0A150GAZ2_GONPE|nr:hypothetical protein GPECTOR_39g437 [Gonium pectorale]|eukprot:KXZ46943.1 hypothetical protein GPECTOR_39g437 [Gonium pectorale]